MASLLPWQHHSRRAPARNPSEPTPPPTPFPVRYRLAYKASAATTSLSSPTPPSVDPPLGAANWAAEGSSRFRLYTAAVMPLSIRPVSPAAVDTLALQDLEVGGGGADCIGGALACARRSSFSYHRLPDPRLRLTVRKLDGSFFDVEIARSAAVWELKVAIEELFFTLFDDTDKTISWQHVWSHFCLCFKDEKLTDDKATLRAFGIRDGDELHFAQHLYVDYTPCKSLSENQKTASHRRSTTWLDDLNKDEGEKFAYSRCSTSVLEDLCITECNEERVEEESRKKRSLFHGWFSFSKRSNRRTHAEDTVPLSCEKKHTGPKLGKWLSLQRFN